MSPLDRVIRGREVPQQHMRMIGETYAEKDKLTLEQSWKIFYEEQGSLIEEAIGQKIKIEADFQQKAVKDYLLSCGWTPPDKPESQWFEPKEV